MNRRVVSSDPELFDEGLDFLFNVLDSISGLRGAQQSGGVEATSSGASQAIAEERARLPKPGDETTLWVHVSGRQLSNKPPDTITDKQLDDIAFGRRVWLAFVRVSWPNQQLLRRYYESPRALAAMAGKGVSEVSGGVVEADIRAAHRAYLAAAPPAESAPVEIDRDVGDGVPDRAKYRERGEVPRTAAERQRDARARNRAWDAGSPLLERHYREDLSARLAEQEAEPLIRGLHAGVNPFPPKQFAALVAFFVEPAAWRSTIERGRFRLEAGDVEIVTARNMKGELVGLREYARRRGLPRTTLQRRVGHLKLAFVKIGQEKRYDIDQLDRSLKSA